MSHMSINAQDEQVFLTSNNILKQIAYDAKIMRLPEIQWLGAFPSDAEKYSIPQHCLFPMTAEGVILYIFYFVPLS